MILTTTHPDALSILSLNRPDKRNAMTPEMFSHLRAAIADARRQNAPALLLTGAGPVFCGGFDLRLCLDSPDTLHTLLVELAATIADLRALDTPVLIAAHGGAIAGACALLGAADIVITNHDAKIGYPVVKLGISPAISAPTLAHMIGDARARERLLDTEVISGREAARIGLATESLPSPDDVLPRAIDLARQLMAKPTTGFAATKQWLRELESAADADSPARALAASLSIVNHPEERDRLAQIFQRPSRA